MGKAQHVLTYLESVLGRGVTLKCHPLFTILT